jgi:acyl-coenzyme A synthetase/AMP-(fatty) acid ligase
MSHDFTPTTRAMLTSAPLEFSETELPKSASGKILKRVLREHFWTDQKRAVS